ncbi:MipA/OmpV family protein [Thalassotalea euphylliae]|uniref:MipA/OmpV family protein n=1 Tax=Thalassotalea euphylliae TaxID=1655234 RepID=UPI003625B9BD
MLAEFFNNKLIVGLCILLLSMPSSSNESGFEKGDKPLPKWELGGVAAGFHSPLYPASSDSQDKALVVPYGIYRGDTIRVGDGSIVKAIALEAPRFKVDVSMAAAFNADSEDSKIREGMPDLDFLFEIGPQFRFLLSDSSIEYGADSEIWLNVQTRAVFSTDFGSINHQGYTIQPQLSWRSKDLLWNDTVAFASLAPIWASEKLHDYFYQIDAQYETERRQQFNAKAGYLGTKVSLGSIFQIKPELSLFTAVQWGLWQGAENEDSALFEEDNNFSAVIGVRYTFMQSKDIVK